MNAVIKTTSETKSSTPALVVFTALAGTGWLLIPLKYAWDELSKKSDAARLERGKEADAARVELTKRADADRAELADQAEDRREIAAKMRDLVFTGIGAHFGPILYRQLSVGVWARRCRDLRGAGCAPPYTRVLYSIGVLEECYDRLGHEGVPLLLRSVDAEREASRCNAALQDCIYDSCGGGEDAADELVRAITTDAPQGRRTVRFSVFKERAARSGGEWAALQKIHSAFVSACENDDKLNKLAECAGEAQMSLTKGLNEVYKEWYGTEGKSPQPSSETRPTR